MESSMKTTNISRRDLLGTLLFAVAVLLCLCSAASVAKEVAAPPPLSDYIRPLVGTQGEGNTYPGPTTPFGMVQPGPDTNSEKFCGYDHADPLVHGFSMTHLSGTGWWDLGDFLFMAGVGEPKFDPGAVDKPRSGYSSVISHDEETASAGYYKIKLRDYSTWVELTAGDRTALMRITFPESKRAWILTDLKHVLHWNVVWSHVRVEDNSTVTGFHLEHGWAKERYLYFAARYSRPFDSYKIISDGKAVVYGGDRFRTRSEIEGGAVRFQSRSEAAGANLRFLAEYNAKKDEVIQVKIAVSAVSAANALKNLDADLPHWDFDRVRTETCKKWDRELSKIQIEGTQEEKETFYTAMYHAFTTPNLYQDVNGEYRGLDQNIHKTDGFANYAIFSLWDTYRAAHPLFALVQAPRDADMINSMLAHYDQSVDRLLPVWSLQANETWCMVGYHAVPVIVDAYFRGVKGFDPERAFQAIKTTAMNPDYDSLPAYDRLGWVPCDWESESVSKTLEYAYDDWCIAQMAKALGKTADYEHFTRRAASYKNIFDPSVGLMRGKDHAGKWRTPFDPHGHVDITEGTSWQYSWYVPQDVPGLIALHGGNEKFTKRLDELFGVGRPLNLDAERRWGVIGSYWHGNEPSHHVIYLYSLAGQNWKAAERVHQVVRRQYGNKPTSLSGNDDCGQMSSWFIFSTLGFYPVCPGSDCYVIGSPCVKKAEMHLSNGKTFTMVAENLSDNNIYIQSVKLNGKDWTQPTLPYSELKDGGTIVFTMGPQPNKAWGVGK
jgi:predicted alpha-1,2-mannosidase